VILKSGNLHDQFVDMNIRRTKSIVGALFLCFCAELSAHAQPADSVRWVSERENATLWAHIRSDFHDELQPDDPAKVAPVLPYSYKYIYRVAVYQDSALVLVDHLETKDTQYPGYYSAFDYDLKSHARTPIKGVEVVSVFRFVRFAALDPTAPPDIVFTWMTCTECEASQVLSAFHYDSVNRQWVLRRWETHKDVWWTSDSGPIIWSDVSVSDTISFECLHGFVKSNGDVAFVVRCREVSEPEGSKLKINDITAKYSFKGAESKLETVTGENKTKLLNELCEGSPKNKLCKGTAPPTGKQ
jgi:hypothetical protein